MKLKKRSTIICLVSLCIVASSLLSCEQSQGAATSKTIAPDFSLSNIDGSTFRLSETKGKVVFLNFWSTGCGPCKDEMPQFEAIYNKYKNKGFVIVGVALDPPADSSAFVKAKGLTFPVVTATRQVVSRYGGIKWIPTTFVIDKDGYMFKKIVGPQSTKTWEDIIEGLL